MSQPIKHFYEFGPFRVDTQRRVLLRGGQMIPLSPTIFDLLLALVESGGHLLGKDDLMRRLWPDSFVEEGSLARNVSRLRAALGEGRHDHLYIETIPKHGYRFVADVREVSEDGAEVVIEEHRWSRIVIEQEQEASGGDEHAESSRAVEAKALGTAATGITTGDAGAIRRLAASRAALAVIAVAALVTAAAVYALYVRSQPTANQPVMKSLAVLPLKSLDREAGDDYLGLGIADTIITKVSQVGGLTVRSTSAVRKYADQEIEALEAARQLQADAVLDGTFLRAGDRLRVSVNLLRVGDGVSLWADSFDMRDADIFAIQDEVAKEVAARLRLKLGPAEQARLAKHHTSNPAAYDYYTKAMYYFSDRHWVGESRGESDRAIELFKKAIELDASYALARAQLGYAYAWTAINFEDNAALIERAKQEVDIAERLDPQLAEVHVARSFIFWSQYEGWQVEAAIGELRAAQQFDPNVGHFELSLIYSHIGLDEQYEKEIELALELDPTSDTIKKTQVNMYYLRAMPDAGLAAEQRFFNRCPGIWYYLEKRMLREAEPLVAQDYQQEPGRAWVRKDRALLLALQGRHREAEAAVPAILEKAHQAHRGYHHLTYEIARIYALGGKSAEAVKWLKETAGEGKPNYTLFLRDSFLDLIRKDSAFIQFMNEMRTRWEGYRREFA